VTASYLRWQTWRTRWSLTGAHPGVAPTTAMANLNLSMSSALAPSLHVLISCFISSHLRYRDDYGDVTIRCLYTIDSPCDTTNPSSSTSCSEAADPERRRIPLIHSIKNSNAKCDALRSFVLYIRTPPLLDDRSPGAM